MLTASGVRLAVAGAFLAGAGIVSVLWASTQMTHGILELPSHWWGGLAAAPLVLGILLVGLGLRRKIAG
jgi:hypothetical protein